MTDKTDPPSSSQSGQAGLVGSCAVLAAAVLLVFPAFAWFGFSRHGFDGLTAAAVAGGVCFLGAAAALVMTGVLRGSQAAVHGVLLGIVFRTGVPLAFGVFLMLRGGPLAETGVFGMVFVYFQVTLTVETLLAIRLVRPASKISKAS